MIIKIYEVSCDGCGTVEHFFHSKKQAIKEIRQRGWHVRADGICACPDCRKEMSKQFPV